MSYKLAIVGYRNYNNYTVFCKWVDDYISVHGVPSQIISGGADGIDHLAELYATAHDIPCKIFEADWQIFGLSAGPRRNTLIVKECDRVLAFPSRKSRGTFNTIKQARDAGKKVETIYID